MTFLCHNFPSNFCFHQAGASRQKIVIIPGIMIHPPFMLNSHSFAMLFPFTFVTMASSDFRRHGQISPPTPPPILHRSTLPPPPSHQRPLPYHPTPTFGWLLCPPLLDDICGLSFRRTPSTQATDPSGSGALSSATLTPPLPSLSIPALIRASCAEKLSELTLLRSLSAEARRFLSISRCGPSLRTSPSSRAGRLSAP
jgi:hypothetical protein